MAKMNNPKLTLNQWVDSIMSKDHRPTINLSHFGLKTPEDVKTFLNSPAGKVVIGKIGAKQSIDKAIKQGHQLAQQQHELLMARLKALILSWFMERKTDAANKYRDLVIKDNEQSIKRAKTTVPTIDPSSASQKSINHAQLIRQYNEIIREAQVNIAMREDLEQHMTMLQHQKEDAEIKYNILIANMMIQEEFFSKLENFTEQTIKEQISKYQNSIDENLLAIQKLIENNQEDQIGYLMDEQNGLHLQIASLYDMLSVLKKEKYYVNDQGVKVKQPKDAIFILSRNDKIIEHDGKLYLLKKNQDWDSIKESPEARHDAHHAFERTKQEYMSVKKTVHHNRDLEITFHIGQIKLTAKTIKSNQNERLVIANKINEMETKNAPLMQAMLTSNLTKPSLMPSPNNTLAAKPSQVPATLFYKEQLDKLKKADRVTRNDLLNLANKAPGENNQLATMYLLMNMPRSGPILPQTMQSLLKNMEQFGLDATKPAVTSLTSPLEEQQEAAKTAPTPFSIKPAGF